MNASDIGDDGALSDGVGGSGVGQEVEGTASGSRKYN